MSNRTKSSGLILQGLDSVIIRVANIRISKDWYQNKLGFNILWEEPKKNVVVFDTGNATSLKLWQSEEKIFPGQKTTSYIILNTPDISTTRIDLISKGLLIEEIIEGEFVVYFFLYDPDGNAIEICQILELK